MRVAAWTARSKSEISLLDTVLSGVGGIGRRFELTFEDGLWLCGERKRGFKRILHAMFSKHLEEFGRCRIGIYDCVGVRNLYTEPIRGEIFAVLS